jgi:hypothetical protein
MRDRVIYKLRSDWELQEGYDSVKNCLIELLE